MNEKKVKNAPETPEWFQTFAEWASGISGELKTTISTLLEREANVEVEQPRFYEAGEMETLYPEGPVCAEVNWTGAEIGSWRFFMPRKFAAALVNVAAGVEPGADFDEETGPAALADIWAQVIASLETDLMSLTGMELNAETPAISLDPEPFMKGIRKCPVLRWNLEVADIGAVALLMAVDPVLEAVISTSADLDDAELDKKLDKGAKSTRTQPVAKSARFEDFEASEPKPGKQARNIDLLMDINLPITIELGRTSMLIKDVLELGPGSIIELDKLSGEPVDLLINDKKFAKGEVVVIEENFGVRITELVDVDERLKALK